MRSDGFRPAFLGVLSRACVSSLLSDDSGINESGIKESDGFATGGSEVCPGLALDWAGMHGGFSPDISGAGIRLSGSL